MAKVEVRLPSLGDEAEGATVQFWHFEEGDEVDKDDDLVELATDKAVFNVPAPVSGVLKEIVASEGDVVKEGDLLAFLERR